MTSLHFLFFSQNIPKGLCSMEHTLGNTDLGVNGEIGYWRAGKTEEKQVIKAYSLQGRPV